MNIVASSTLAALAKHGVPDLPSYRRALAAACDEAPPPFGRKAYADLYRLRAREPRWVALCLARAADGEGDGAEHLWDLAASTDDPEVSKQVQQHAIDESRHSLAYVTLLEQVFPGVVESQWHAAFRQLSPGYTQRSVLAARQGSPYARPVTVDELIQMNIAEIRTRVHQVLQAPVLLALCDPDRRRRVRRILDSLLLDETRHIAYTARLIERAARRSGVDEVMNLMRERIRDFNEITEAEVARRAFSAG